jgi:hypothetical protein
MADASGGVLAVDGTFTADKFVGIAGSEVKSAFTYVDQGEAGGKYAAKEAVDAVLSTGASVGQGMVAL